jgi:CheY-like chemotaxis protein
MTDPTIFLVVEDDPNDVLLVRMELEQFGSKVRMLTVDDGQEAMHYLEGKGNYRDRTLYPLPDVILLDLKMPKVDGFDFLNWLRHESPGRHHLIPVVVMSSSAFEKDIERAYELGANSYLVKPINWNAFRGKIRALGLYWVESMETPETDSHQVSGDP